MNTSSVVPFYFHEKEIRALTIDNDPWFVAKDICDVLEMGTEQTRRLDDDERGLRKVQTLSGDQDMIIISESGLYTLIIRSNKPQAKPFRKWVTAEVLPTIRKTGGYAIPKGDKRVFVSHAHSKTTNAPGGLDIRYTMDLGKIVANPTRRSVEMLERLTGIQLTDIPLQDDSHGEEIAAQVNNFCRDRCRYADGVRLTFAEVYAAYRKYCLASSTLPMATASKRRFSSLLAAAGFAGVKIGGTAYLNDIAIKNAEVM